MRTALCDLNLPALKLSLSGTSIDTEPAFAQLRVEYLVRTADETGEAEGYEVRGAALRKSLALHNDTMTLIMSTGVDMLPYLPSRSIDTLAEMIQAAHDADKQ